MKAYEIDIIAVGRARKDRAGCQTEPVARSAAWFWAALAWLGMAALWFLILAALMGAL